MIKNELVARLRRLPRRRCRTGVAESLRELIEQFAGLRVRLAGQQTKIVREACGSLEHISGLTNQTIQGGRANVLSEGGRSLTPAVAYHNVPDLLALPLPAITPETGKAEPLHEPRAIDERSEVSVAE